MQKRGRETRSRALFDFFKKASYKEKQVVCTLVLIYFGRPRLGHTTKTFQIVDLEICSILMFYKRVCD